MDDLHPLHKRKGYSPSHILYDILFKGNTMTYQTIIQKEIEALPSQYYGEILYNEYKEHICIFHAMKCRSIFFHLLEDLGENYGNND